jgi:FKBP-type peptidyl-prolyl cis-trans isomerase FkpA
MKSTLKFIAACACACTFALTACGGGSDDDTAVVIDPTTQPAGFTTTDTFVPDTGLAAASGDLITVTYTGWLYKSDATTAPRGTQFDTNVGGSPLAFVLGTGRVIPGWDQGIVGMKVGGKRTLIIPASMGYGATAHGNIPANSGLVFDVELVSVKKSS